MSNKQKNNLAGLPEQKGRGGLGRRDFLMGTAASAFSRMALPTTLLTLSLPKPAQAEPATTVLAALAVAGAVANMLKGPSGISDQFSSLVALNQAVLANQSLIIEAIGVLHESIVGLDQKVEGRFYNQDYRKFLVDTLELHILINDLHARKENPAFIRTNYEKIVFPQLKGVAARARATFSTVPGAPEGMNSAFLASAAAVLLQQMIYKMGDIENSFPGGQRWQADRDIEYLQISANLKAAFNKLQKGRLPEAIREQVANFNAAFHKLPPVFVNLWAHFTTGKLPFFKATNFKVDRIAGQTLEPKANNGETASAGNITTWTFQNFCFSSANKIKRHPFDANPVHVRDIISFPISLEYREPYSGAGHYWLTDIKTQSRQWKNGHWMKPKDWESYAPFSKQKGSDPKYAQQSANVPRLHGIGGCPQIRRDNKDDLIGPVTLLNEFDQMREGKLQQSQAEMSISSLKLIQASMGAYILDLDHFNKILVQQASKSKPIPVGHSNEPG